MRKSLQEIIEEAKKDIIVTQRTTSDLIFNSNDLNEIESYAEFINLLNILFHSGDLNSINTKIKGIESYLDFREKRGKKDKKDRKRLSVSFDRHSIVREALIQDIEERKFRYLLPEGLYYLALDTGFSPHALFNIIGSREMFEIVIGDSQISSQIRWNPQNIDLKVEDCQAIIGHIKTEYHTDDTRFFQRYGNRAGTFFIAHDMPEMREKDIRLSRIRSLVCKGEVISRITEIEDQRFETSWNPDVMWIRYSSAVKLKEALLRRYKDDKDAFYEFFSGLLGNLAFVHELRKEGISDINKQTVVTVFGTPEKTAAFLEVNENEMKQRWSLCTINSETEFPFELLNFVRQEYETNPDVFFERYYFDELGVINLSREYRDKRKKDIKLSPFSTILSNGLSLRKITNHEDARFGKRAIARRFDTYISDLELIISFCKERFYENPGKFFSEYGRTNGILNLERDITNHVELKIKNSKRDIRKIAKNGRILARLMGVVDFRFENQWNPRHCILNDEQYNVIFNFLSKEYKENSVKFFERYGSLVGVANLENDLKKEGIEISACELSQLLLDPEFLQNNLRISDCKFKSQWNPRSIQIKSCDRGQLVNLLKTSYEEDPIKFLVRYGSEAGLYLLQEDHRRRTGRVIPLSQIGTIMTNPKIVSEFTGISLELLNRDWNPKVIQLSDKTVNSIGIYLKELHESSPDTFFDYFKNGFEGLFYLIGKFKNNNKKVPNVRSLTNAIKNKGLVSLLIGCDDPRFKEWDPPITKSASVRSFETAIDQIKEAYSVNPEHFYGRYGSLLGAVELARDVKNRGIRNVFIPEVHSLIGNAALVQSVLEIEDERINEKWNPICFRFTLADFETIKEYLQKHYNKNPEQFFYRYGSRVNKLILAKEMNGSLERKVDLNNYSSILINGEVTAKILGINDERFNSQWKTLPNIKGKKGLNLNDYLDQVDNVMRNGFIELAKDVSLPKSAEERSADYLTVRRILRVAEKENGFYLAQLYAPESILDKVNESMHKQIEMDKSKLSIIAKLKDQSQVEEYGEDKFCSDVGKLLYSFDDTIRTLVQEHLVRLYSDTISRMTIVRDNPELMSIFHDYCINADLYHINRFGERIEPHSFISDGKAFLVTTYRGMKLEELRNRKKRRETSIDQKIDSYEKGGSFIDTIIA